MPKVSIIVPVYNTEKWISRCLDSLIKQTLKDIEIICVNDGSTDNSLKILEEYAQKDKRIRVISQENDKGSGQARNVAVKASKAPYLMFCDSDDWYEPIMCQKMYDTIEKEKVDIVFCHCFFDFEENLSDFEKEKRVMEKYFNPDFEGRYEITPDFIGRNNVCIWEKIFKKEIVLQNGITFYRHNPYDDFSFFWMYTAVSKSMFHLKTPLHHYFLRAGSIMSINAHKKEDKKDYFIEVGMYILDFLIKKNLHHQYHRQMIDIYSNFLNDLKETADADYVRKQTDMINKRLRDAFPKKKEFFVFYEGEIFVLRNQKKILSLFQFFKYGFLSFLFKKKKKFRRKFYHAKLKLMHLEENQ